MKEKKVKKIKQLPGKIATGVSAFILAAAGAYFLTPVKTRVVDLGKPKSEDEEYSQNFDHFLTKLLDYTENGIDGLHAEFVDFNVQFQEEGKALNNIDLDGYFDFKMRNLNDIELKMDADVDYNGVHLPLTFGYADSTVFMAFKDLKIKSSSQNTDSLFTIFKYYLTSSAGLNIDAEGQLDKLVSSVMGSSSTTDLTSSLSSITGGGMSFKLGDEETENGYLFTVTVNSNSMAVDIEITTDKDYTMENVNFKKLEVAGVKISGQIDMDIRPINITTPDFSNGEWVEMIAYSGWIEKLANLLGESNQKLGMTFGLDVSLKGKEMGSIKGDVNVDFSRLIDFTSIQNEPGHDTPHIPGDDPKDEGYEDKINAKRSKMLDTVKEMTSKVQLGVNVNMYGQKGTLEEAPLYATLGVDYVNNDGYIRLNENEGVMKAVVESDTINWLISDMPNLINDTIKSLGVNLDSSKLSSSFDFITDSTVVSSLKEGDYSKILNILKTLKSTSEDHIYETEVDNEIKVQTITEGQILVELDLSILGLGENALVKVILDSSRKQDAHVLDVEVNNLEMGDVEINFNVKSSDFKEVNPGDKTTYDNMNFLPGVISQVAGMVQSKVGSFGLEGSVLDDNGLGLTLTGDAVFSDVSTNRFGYGQLEIKQYKYHADKVWYTHNIALDVRNNNPSMMSKDNNIKFVYGKVNPGEGEHNIQGKMTVQTILDIKDLVMEFVNGAAGESKFTKFLAPLKEMMTMGEISEIVESGDYLSFAKSTFIKKIAQSNGGNALDIVIAGNILGLDSDLNLRLELEDNGNGSKRMTHIRLVNLKAGGKTINFSAYIDENYNGEDHTPLNLNAQYMDFSDIKTLLRFGINTTELGVYELSGTINLTALKIFNTDFYLNAYVVVDGVNVKVYVTTHVKKLLSFASGLIQEDYGLFDGTKDVKSELTFETYKTGDPNKTNDIGGYFDIKRSITHTETYTDWTFPFVHTRDAYKYVHYRCTSDYFLDNIIFYLLGGFMGIKKDTVDSIGNLALGNDSEEKAPGEYTNVFTSTGFQYDEATTTWNVGINIGALTGIEALQSIEATIVGKEVDGKGYFHNLDGTLNIQASLASIVIGFDLTLDNIDPSKTDWSQDIADAFAGIRGVSFSSNDGWGSYLNNTSKYRTI